MVMTPIAVDMPKITSTIISSFEDVVGRVGSVGRAGSVRLMEGIGGGGSHGRKPARYMAMKVMARAVEPKASLYLCFMIGCVFCGGAVGGFMGDMAVVVEGSVSGGGGVFVNWYRVEPSNT